jgi:hypothetical protein
MEKTPLCVCNNCNNVYADNNPQINQFEATDKGYPELAYLKDNEDQDEVHFVWSCPKCKTDYYLMDITDAEMLIDRLREKMDSNGFASFDNEAFLNKTKQPCYIPENADSDEDIYNYYDLLELVKEFAKDNPKYLKHHQIDVDAILNNMMTTIEWTAPSTFLNELTNY